MIGGENKMKKSIEKVEGELMIKRGKELNLNSIILILSNTKRVL